MDGKQAVAHAKVERARTSAVVLAERAIRQLKDLQQQGDTEAQHGKADAILCELLAGLGYDDVAAEWGLVPKWYA